MAENISIDSISLQITSDASDAESSIESLASSLAELKSSLTGGYGKLKTVADNIKLLKDATNGFDTGKLKSVSDSLVAIGSVNVKDNGILKMTSSLSSLSKESKNFDASILKELGNSIHYLSNETNSAKALGSLASGLASLSKSGDKMQSAVTNLPSLTEGLRGLAQAMETFDMASIDSISAFVKSLASLARSGEQLKTTSNYFPAFAMEIREFTDLLSSASGSGLGSISAFLQSLTSLSRVGDKMGQTANAFPTLASELQKFFIQVSQVDVSDNVVRLAEALAQIAQSGKGAASALGAASKAANGFSAQSNATRYALQGIKLGFDVFKASVGAFADTLRTIGGLAKTALGKVVDKFKELTSHKGSLESFTGTVKTLVAAMVGFHGITGIFNWVKTAIQEGAGLAEINHIIESVFDESMLGQVEDWANGALNAFGIASTAAKKYAGTLTAMFQSSNIGIRESGKMAMDLVGLAGDLSAFYNIDTETAYNKIKSGMAGMVRPLRKQHCAFAQRCA